MDSASNCDREKVEPEILISGVSKSDTAALFVEIVRWTSWNYHAKQYKSRSGRLLEARAISSALTLLAPPLSRCSSGCEGRGSKRLQPNTTFRTRSDVLSTSGRREFHHDSGNFTEDLPPPSLFLPLKRERPLPSCCLRPRLWNSGCDVLARFTTHQSQRIRLEMSSNLAGSMVFCPPDSDGLQVHPYDQYPERYVRTLDTSFIDSKELAPTSPQQYDSSILRDTSNEVSERPLTKRRNWIWTSAALISVIVIVVIIIVAVLLSRKHSGSPSISGNAAPADSNLPTPKDGNQGPSAFTKQGAFNGTGMATMFPYTNSDSVWLLYQHFDGDIQLARLSSSGVWQKPEALGLKNVLNGTALEAMSYESDRMVIVSHSIPQNLTFLTSALRQSSISSTMT